MQSIHEDLQKKNIQIVAISADPVNKLDEMVEKLGLAFPILSDPDLVAIDAVGLRHPDGFPTHDIARPAMFLLDANRKIVWTEYPDDWRIRPTADTILRNIQVGSPGGGGY